MHSILIVEQIMSGFSVSTGLSGTEKFPKRYLWTDAFAVCNFLELYLRTGDEKWQQLALRLVDQVHQILGKHRGDDPRTGWISALSEEEGRHHPTIGGLRIGKPLNERKAGEPYDDALEWERDGQYFHYLTKWMHTLNRMSRLKRNPIFNFWAIELAKAVHAAFVHTLPSGSKRMAWKMSIDLSRPSVPFMGLHDPLDGLVTYNQLRATASEFSKTSEPGLFSEIADMEALCKGIDWTTEDSLGIGGMLWDAYKILQLIVKDGFKDKDLLNDLLEFSLKGLEACMESPLWNFPADARLAFRELGLTIGLHAVERMEVLTEKNPDQFPPNHPQHAQIARFDRYAGLSETIEKFWLDPRSRKSISWTKHRDINEVMLATSLAPDGYLEL
jgi:hypothetical protein